jgi:8-hydroxy-5-deazaflavin:NADPH oxidoreductase
MIARKGSPMTAIGFIGSGNIGGAVATLSIAAGHQVVLSNSRGPQTLTALVAELGPLARSATAAAAAAAAEIAIVAIPLRAYRTVPIAPLAGKVVIDAGNYYPPRDGQIAELDSGSVTSSELLQQHLPGSRVVKAFNNIAAGHVPSLSRPAGAPDRAYLPIAGDDASAKAVVTAFLDSIGYSAVDVGRLADGWRQEIGEPVFVAPYGPPGAVGTPAGEAAIRSALAEATR